MHHHVFPSEDAFITSQDGLKEKNFGIDEFLRIGTNLESINIKNLTKDFQYNGSVSNVYCLENFTGTVVGILSGSTMYSSGSISGSFIGSSSFFQGDLIGSYSGYINGIFEEENQFTGSINNFSGSIISNNIVGYITGSSMFEECSIFSGSLENFSGYVTGYIYGINTVNMVNWSTVYNRYINRSLLNFDLTSISESISSGKIENPRFVLKLKISNEYELPMKYTIYAFPISQSWTLGSGEVVYGGTDNGVSWTYKDSGSIWYFPTASGIRPVLDFFNTQSNSDGSFKYGGGTWYYTDGTISLMSTQSFYYESSDINMDITPMAMAWIENRIPNNGVILMASSEISSTESDYLLEFYSRDTNSVSSPCLDVMWDDFIFITGSSGTGSVIINKINSGFLGRINSGSLISGIELTGSFIGIGNIYPDINTSSSGYINAMGISGSISGLKISGPIFGEFSQSIDENSGNESSHIVGNFINGPFSGSNFIANYNYNYQLTSSLFTGSWSENVLSSSYISANLPQKDQNDIFVNISGSYINGDALGTYISTDPLTNGTFIGRLINGLHAGMTINCPVNGYYLEEDYFYTSSIEITSSILNEISEASPFIVTIQNLKPTYKFGDVPKIKIFSRNEFPLKTFERSTQQSDYVTPKYLLTAYWGIKDTMSEEMIIGFDEYTKISCEYPGGNYFYMDTTGLSQERIYKILIKVITENLTHTIDSGKTFKIIR
jgi:hypothetical protein